MSNRSSSSAAALLGSREIWVVRGPNGSGKTTLLRRFLETGIAQLDQQPPVNSASAKPEAEPDAKPTPAKSGLGKD